MTPPRCGIALTVLLLNAACGTSVGGTTDPGPFAAPPSASAAGPSPSGCPSPQPLDSGKAAAVDYVDLVVHDGITFISARSAPEGAQVAVPAADVGPVVFTVTCELSEFTRSGTVQPPGLLPDSAGQLPAGTDVHSVNGFAPTCRLTARRDGAWTAYLAQREVNRVSTVEPCAYAPSTEPASPGG